jgi:hypothetical protein
MKTLKTILLSLFIAASMGAVSTSALAESDPGRITYKPAEAIDMVVAKIQAAIEGISKGASNDEAAALIKQASDLSKEINANDKLRAAREAFEAGDTATGEAGLAEALKSFTEMKAQYDVTHK